MDILEGKVSFNDLILKEDDDVENMMNKILPRRESGWRLSGPFEIHWIPLGKHAFLNTRIPTRENLINLVVYGYISGTVRKNIPKLYGKALGISLFRNAKTQPSRTRKSHGGNSGLPHRQK